MIELGDEQEYEVSVTAVLGVERKVRVKARGESHARIVARQLAKDDPTTHIWKFDDAELSVPADRISEILTGMCPKLVE